MWISHNEGIPVWINGKAMLSFENYQYIPHLLLVILSWAWAIATQVAFVLAYFAWLILAYSFLVLWLLFGFWCFQNKTLGTRRVWNLWFGVWTGDNSMATDVEISIGILNESLLTEFALETLPQLGLQFLNNQLTQSWSMIGYFSMFFTVSMATNGTYRYLYWILWRGYELHEIPAEVSLFGFFAIKLEHVDATNKDKKDVIDAIHESTEIDRTPAPLVVDDVELTNSVATAGDKTATTPWSPSSACISIFALLTDSKFSIDHAKTVACMEMLGVYKAGDLLHLELDDILKLAEMLKPSQAKSMVAKWKLRVHGASDRSLVIHSEAITEL